MANRKRDDERSCCSWPKIILLLVLIVASGVLIWQYAPIDTAIDQVIPTFNNTFGGGGEGVFDGSVTGSSGDGPPETDYVFNQCIETTAEGEEAQCCNGLESNCDLPVNQVLFATVHNAQATFEDGFLFGPNHRYQFEGALEAGYRGINLDICNCGGTYKFCHGLCDLGTRDVVETIVSIDTWLDNNPNEFLVVPIEMNSEADQLVEINEVYELLQEVPSFLEKMYVHADGDDINSWPTLGEAIQDDKRVLLFHFRGPNCDEQVCPVGMHHFWEFTSTTPFDFSSVAKIQDTNSSCALRDAGSADRPFFLVNNFITAPDPGAAARVNTLEAATARLEECSELNGNNLVNFFYVDYWSEGDIPEMTQIINADRAQQRFRHERYLRADLDNGTN